MPSPGDSEQGLPANDAAAASASAASDQAATTTAPANTPADVTASSSDAPAETRETLLEVVKNALKEGSTGQESPPRSGQDPKANAEAGQTGDPNAEAPPAEGEGEQTDPEADPSEEELRAYKPKTRERIQKLIKQRDVYRDRATSFDNIDAFLQQNNLTPIAAANALKAAAMIQAAQEGRLDPATALKEIDQYRTVLLQLTGEVLPADVKQKLDDGLIDEDSARELARRRQSEKVLATRVDRTEQAAATQQQVMQTTALRQGVLRWAGTKQTQDPDFASVYPELETEVLATFARQGRPATIEAAYALLEGAYARAKTKLVGRQAPPKGTTPQPSSSATATTAVAMDPKALLALPLAERVKLAAAGKGLPSA